MASCVYSVNELLEMTKKAKTPEEYRKIRSFIHLSSADRENAHKSFDDGIYANGILVGEKHPDD